MRILVSIPLRYGNPNVDDNEDDLDKPCQFLLGTVTRKQENLKKALDSCVSISLRYGNESELVEGLFLYDLKNVSIPLRYGNRLPYST